MSNKIDTDNFWNAFHESVGPSTSEALDNDTKKLGIPAVRFITEDWKSLIEEIRQEARREALKEMDGRWMDLWAEFGTPGRPNGKHYSEISKDIMALRKEYLNQP